MKLSTEASSRLKTQVSSLSHMADNRAAGSRVVEIKSSALPDITLPSKDLLDVFILSMLKLLPKTSSKYVLTVSMNSRFKSDGFCVNVTLPFVRLRLTYPSVKRAPTRYASSRKSFEPVPGNLSIRQTKPEFGNSFWRGILASFLS